VAPVRFAPFFIHWYARLEPVATTLKVAVAGAVTVRDVGWVVMLSAGAEVTVRRADLLVMAP